jgi:hypothetical protein
LYESWLSGRRGWRGGRRRRLGFRRHAHNILQILLQIGKGAPVVGTVKNQLP